MLEVGVYNDMSIEEYHADKSAISSSRLKECYKSLMHYRTYYDEEQAKKMHLDFGNAFEACLLDAINNKDNPEGNNVNLAEKIIYVLDESQRPEPEKNYQVKVNKTWREEQFEEAGNRYIVPKEGSESMYTIGKMTESVMRDDLIVKLLSNTDYQKTAVWKDKKTQILLKTRPDVCSMNKNVLVDIKTTLDASPQSFHRDITKYHYPLQAALQMRGCVESGMLPSISRYYWLAVEKTRPYNAQLYMFDIEDWDLFNKHLDFFLHKINEATVTGKWTNYSLFSDYGFYESGNKYGVIRTRIPNYYKDLI